MGLQALKGFFVYVFSFVSVELEGLSTNLFLQYEKELFASVASFVSRPEEDVQVQVLVQNSVCSEGCFYFMHLLKCANSSAKLSPHS